MTFVAHRASHHIFRAMTNLAIGIYRLRRRGVELGDGELLPIPRLDATVARKLKNGIASSART